MASRPESPINFLLLVELIVIVITASAFLFYWNRLLGTLAAALIRLFTWRSHSAYISIGSLQISPLAGRILFRDVEYHSSNLSVRALHGHITFRYWIFRVRQEEDTQSNKSKRNHLPCRINIFAEGVEGFVFNRTPAYDAIVERMKKHEQEDPNKSDDTLAQSKSNATNKEESFGLGARLRRVAKSTTSGTSQRNESLSYSGSTQEPAIDPHALPLQPKPVKTPSLPGVNWLRETLPVEVHITNGSFVLGSDSTPSVLVASFHRSDGTLEVSDSRSVCDEYKLSVNLSFDQPTVLMRTNVDYSGPILAHGKKVYEEVYKQEPKIAKQPPSALSSFLGFHALSKRFDFIRNPKFSSPPVAGLPTDRPWKGLARYRVGDDRTGKPAKKEEREYAKVTTLVKSESLDLTYYADTPGIVPHPSDVSFIDETDEYGNVDLPPEYGVDIVIRNGVVNYGPWADRQRDALQRTFAPSIFFDSEPKPRLQPGDTRIHSSMVVNVEFADKTTLRIPTREPSKNWEHEHKPREETRTYGWLDVVVGSGSSITYTQTQFATKRGYDAMLVLHLDTLAISSSVNYLPFLDARTCKLSMTMPTPLSWNARRDWGLDLVMDAPKISLLRDHVQLISDLAIDWSSGSSGDFHHFVPNHYNFRVTLLNYGVHLCLNDFNIIDAPSSREHNAFMDITGPRLESYVAVASTQYRPDFSTIPFTAKLENAVVSLSLPAWDTHRSFEDKVSFEVGKIGSVKAEGSYTFYSTPHPDHQEMLVLHLEGERVCFKALGWALRRLFCTKDNYFGGFTQFATSAEFLERFDHDPKSVGDPIEQKYLPGRSDSFQVQVTMNVTESLVLLSDEIYSCDRGLAMPVPQLQMALKSVEHFMELSLDAMPTYIVATPDLEKSYDLGIAPPIASKEAIFLEGVEVRANRLFGPQPRATTYLCLWEIVAPRITAFLSPEFVATIQSAVAAVIYNFNDVENAPASFYVPETPPDVTFFKLGIDQISATLFAGDKAVTLDLTDGINLDTSSLATRSFSSAVGLVIPSVAVALLQLRPAGTKWDPVGIIKTKLALDFFSAPSGWQDKADKQQRFLREEDRPTGRITYMYDLDRKQSSGLHFNALYLPIQRPLGEEEIEVDIHGSDIDSVREARPGHGSSSSAALSASDASIHAKTPARKRSASFTLPKTPRRRSFVDESDTFSEDTDFSSDSASSNKPSNPGLDLANGLADRLKMFRSTRDQALPVFPDWPEDSHTQGEVPSQPRRLALDGSVICLALGRVDVDGGSRTVVSAFALASAIQAIEYRPEVQLDQLLIHHTNLTLEEGKPKLATLIDITSPRVRVRISTDMSAGAQNDLEFDLSGLAGSIAMQPTGHSKTTDLAISCRSLSLTTLTSKSSSQELSLADLNDSDRSYHSAVPVLRVSSGNISFGFSQDAEQQIRAKSDEIVVQAVTQAAMCSIDMFRRWERALSSLTTGGSGDRSPLHLLQRIIKGAIETKVSTSAPSFIYEGGYELHAKDQRNIRRDPGWIMIARLRHWLRQSQIQSESHASFPVDDPARYVVTEMARLEESFCGDEALVRSQPFVKKCIGPAASAPNGAPEATQAEGIFVSLRSLSLQHHGRMLESGTIATSEISLGTASLGVHKSSTQQDGKPLENLRLLVGVKQIRSEMQDGILPAIQAILGLAHDPDRTDKDVAVLNPSTGVSASKLLVLDIQMEDVQLAALAGGLKLRLALRNIQQSLTRHSKAVTMEDEKVNEAASHDSVFASADFIEASLLQPRDEDDLVAQSPDRIVLCLKVEAMRLKVDNRSLGVKDRPTVTKVVFGVGSVDFDSRPQLRAFLAFARDWQKRHLGLYRPLINDIRGLVVRKKARIVPDSPVPPDVHLDLSIGAVLLQVRAAKAVWLRWEIGKVYITRHGCTDDVEFGVRIAPQVVGAYTTMKSTKDRDASSMRLPSLTTIGSHRRKNDRPHISATVALGFFIGVLKPAVLDRLLSLHQRLGKDIMHIVDEYRAIVRKELAKGHAKLASTNSTMSIETETSEPAVKPTFNLLIDLKLSAAGVRFGLRADDVATTLLFEALAIRGSVSNTTTENSALFWRARAEHLGLSLGHLGSADISDAAEPIRKHRSAYMVLDVDIQEIPGHETVASQLNVSLNRVHTVMHVAALSEISDLVKSWQSDLHILRDNRADDVAEVKTTTSKILKKLEGGGGKPVQPEESWFASRLFTVHVLGFGMAVPLDEAAAIDLDHRQGLAVPALLFSIRVVSFQNRKNETARFRVQRMSLQFLEKFDQGVPEHFMGDYNPSINRMLLPSLDTEAQMASSPEVWSLSAHCSATDFKLSLAPDVVSGVHKLIDLYDLGKQRLVELEQQYRAELAKREALDSVHAKYAEAPSQSPARPRQQIVVRMSYTFNSGVVELHRSPDSPAAPVSCTPKGRTTWHDTFTLPTISLWMDYEGPKVNGVSGSDEDMAGSLVFNSAVHESRNTVRPTILPFAVDLVNRIESRLRSKPRRTSIIEAERKAAVAAATVSESTLQVIAPTPGATVRLRVTLRIDRSELRLSCAPDSNAYVDLKWESGGFMASTSLGASDEVSTVAGSISGVRASLSHEFADHGRSCVEAGTKDLAFSVTHCPGHLGSEKGLSVVLESQLSGQFRLDAFSAWLIFTSVWIDNAPSLDTPLRAAIPEAVSTTAVPENADTASESAIQDDDKEPIRPKLAVAALIRFRTIVLDTNIGVSQAKLEISPVVLRTISNGEKTEVDLQIGKTEIVARGDISGNLRSDKLIFNTMRRSSRASEQTGSTVLAMSIDAGDLRANLFLGQVNILRFHLEPAFVSLADDWKASLDGLETDQDVALTFGVRAGNLVGVLRLLSIPRLLSNLYSVLDMVDSQQRIAVQRSEIFKASRKRKKENPSPVAAAILQSARRASTAPAGHVRTAQTMRFDLAGIDIGVFNEDHESGGHIADFYRFVIGKVEANLKRQVSKEGVPTRDLALLISLVQWDYSDGARVAAKEKAGMDAKSLIEMAWRQGHKSVASLPSMTMTMKSRELSHPAILDFDFDLVWGETDGDIGILPNFFEQAISAFKKLIKGIEEQELARMKRDPSYSPSTEKDRKVSLEDDTPLALDPTLEYRPRDPTWADDPPLPKLKQLGESTREAATFIPKIKSATKELPVLSHKFVTLPLEEGMDLLLKLYEKQLPERYD